MTVVALTCRAAVNSMEKFENPNEIKQGLPDAPEDNEPLDEGEVLGFESDITPGKVDLIRSLAGGLVAVQSFMPSHRMARDKIRMSRMDPNDVLLCAYPKTGTHWTWEMLLMLSRGEATHSKDSKVTAWIDVVPVDEVQQKYQSPRIMNTHYPLGHFSREFRNGCKVVYLIRNPKDVLISLLYHVNDQLVKKKTLSEYLSMFLHSPYNVYGSYFDNVADGWTFRDDPNVLILFYEETKKNHLETVRKVARFIGIPASDKLIEEIALATSFSTMKVGKYDSEEPYRKIFGEDVTLYRKGAVGDWKNHLTVAQNEEFDRYISEWNKERKIPFIYQH